jgi:hypothetical protein
MLHGQVAAPGKPAILPVGIVYQAFWQDAMDGMARHARAQVCALARAGVPVALHGIDVRGRYFLDQDIDPEVAAEVGYLRRISFSETLLAIRQLVLSTPRHLEETICPAGGRIGTTAQQRAIYASTIVYTSWERSTVPKPLVEVLNRCAEVWLPCSANVNAFERSGVRSVHRIPCPYDPEHRVPGGASAADIPAPRGSDRVPEGRRFYSIGKWEPRKGLHELIGAFLLAFTPDDRVRLRIKTWDFRPWKDYPTPEKSLRHWLDEPRIRGVWTADHVQRRIHVVSAKLPPAEMVALHRNNNIYVSASHGEAWDLPAFDAVAAGNRLVHVGYGGSEAYAPADAIRVPHGLGPVHPGYGWEPEAEWAEYRLDDLVHALRMAEPPKKRVHPPDLYARAGAHGVGSLMRQRIEAVLRQLGGYDRFRGAGAFG